MSAAVSTLHVALLGNPNCGKTALFNLLTGARQKVANYAGVTVERKEGLFTTASGKRVRLLDLPGAYSLNAISAEAKRAFRKCFSLAERHRLRAGAGIRARRLVAHASRSWSDRYSADRF